jgi:hypothetical protein
MRYVYRAAAHAFTYAAALPNPTFGSPMPKQIAWHEVSARVLSIGMALEVPTAELDEVLADIALAAAGRSDGSQVVDFAGRHGASIDFLIAGDLLPLIAGVRAGRPVMFA